MSPPASTPIILPVGPNPGWELKDGNDEEQKQKIPASCVLLHALRQSRQKWLSSTFPLFSTRARGAKSIDHIPPPHAIQLRGRCDLEIGPHIFSDTLFFEVHYLPPQAHQPPGKIPPNTSAQAPSSSSSTTQTLNPEGQQPTPLISSLNSVATITPALINQVNTAASTNPTLANLLRLAAAGLATPEQLKTLGLLIQSLATAESSDLLSSNSAGKPSSAPATTTTSTAVLPVKDFDLVLEFRETSSERWVFPRGPVTCERTVNSSVNSLSESLSDITINACLPFPTTKPLDTAATDQANHNPDDETLQVVSFNLRGAPPLLWDTISRWVGNEQQVEQSKSKLSAIKPAQHVYLGYQLPEGPLLNQLQSATAPVYSMKSIKASATSVRSRRKPAKEKNDASKPNGGGNSSSKRSRVVRAERSSATQIQCLSCKSQDVPLIFGGRFCRPCVDSGRAATTYTQPYRFTPYVLTPVPTPQSVPQPTTATPVPATQ